MKVWRPRMRKGRVSITRHGNFFAVACRGRNEADAVQAALIKTLVAFREKLTYIPPTASYHKGSQYGTTIAEFTIPNYRTKRKENP